MDVCVFVVLMMCVVGNGDWGGDVGMCEKWESVWVLMSGDDVEVDVSFAARGAATVEELVAFAGLEFRIFYCSYRLWVDEMFGSMMWEWWRWMFSKKLVFVELYSNKFEVVKFFIWFYGVSFAAMFVLVCCLLYVVCMCVSVFGMIGFVLFVKFVGVGDWVLSVLDFMKDGF